MVNDLITLPDEHLKYVSHESDGANLKIHVKSTRAEAICPYCGIASNKVHSRYTRTLRDLPIQGKKVKLILAGKKYFCLNVGCRYKTFAEEFEFFEPNSKRTKRLQTEILRVALTQSSVSASKYLRNSVVDIGKSAICDMLKKERENH